MPGTITPLPVMLEEADRKIYEKLEAPKSIVCRYGYMRMIIELPYDGSAKPGCGSKLVIRSPRGTELAEMLTTTCNNSGCGKSITRKQMLQYIDNSGGKNYPFTTQGKVLRVATHDDLEEQAHLDGRKPQIIQFTKENIRELDLAMRLVDVEMLLGGDRVIFHYTAEQWVDFRELVRRLAAEFQTRIEMHQVNARDEARLVADYEKCGQHCCCKQFLKVLKPVSMRSAKVQKATLDPAKISGRCGRLMCCLRYEDQTYETLRKRLPHRQTVVMTDDGPGKVIQTQILTQLVLVDLDSAAAPCAYPLENIQILSKEEIAELKEKKERAASAPPAPPRSERRPRLTPAQEKKPADGQSSESGYTRDRAGESAQAKGEQPASSGDESSSPKRGRRRRRRGRRGGSGRSGGPGEGAGPEGGGGSSPGTGSS